MDERIRKLLSSQSDLLSQDNSKSDNTQSSDSQIFKSRYENMSDTTLTNKRSTYVSLPTNNNTYNPSCQNFDSLQSRIISLEEKVKLIEDLESDFNLLKVSLSQLKEEIECDSIHSSIQNKSGQIQQYSDNKSTLKKFKDDISNLSKRIDSLNDNIGGISNQLSEIETTNSEFISKLYTTESKVDNINQIIIRDIEDKINLLRARIETTKTSLDGSVNILKDTVSNINNKVSALSLQYITDSSTTNDSISDINSKLLELKQKISSLPFEGKIATLTTSVGSISQILKEMTTQNQNNEEETNLLREKVNFIDDDFLSFKTLSQTELSSLISKVSKLKDQNDKLTSDFNLSIKRLDDTIRNITNNNQDNTKDSESINDSIKSLSSKIETLSSDLDTNSESLEGIFKLIDKISDQNKDLSKKYKDLNGKFVIENQEQNGRITSINSKIETFISLQGQLSSLIGNINSLNTRLESHITTETNERRGLSELISTLSKSTNDSLMSIGGRIDKNETDIASSKISIGDLISKIGDLNTQINKLNGDMNQTTLQISKLDFSGIKSSVAEMIKSNGDLSANVSNLTIKQNDLSASQMSLNNMFVELKSNFDSDERFTNIDDEIKDILKQLKSLADSSSSKEMNDYNELKTAILKNQLSIAELETNNKATSDTLSLIKTDYNSILRNIRSLEVQLGTDDLTPVNKSINDLKLKFVELLEKLAQFQRDKEDVIILFTSRLAKLESEIGTSSPNSDISMSINKLINDSTTQQNQISSINSIITLIQKKLDNQSTNSGIESSLSEIAQELGNIDDKLGDSKIFNGSEPDYKMTAEASINQVIKVPYRSTSQPCRIRVMLQNQFEVPLSKTDGYLYSYFNNEILILCGSNSIGSTFSNVGKVIDRNSGQYVISIWK